MCVWEAVYKYAVHGNVLHVCVCVCVRVCCLQCWVLPELQATSAGGCSLITVINLATDRGQERQGGSGWRGVRGRGWMEDGGRGGSVKAVCF